MRIITEEQRETPKQRRQRQALEDAGVIKSKEDRRREREKAKDKARQDDYNQKQQTLEYKRDRLKWQQNRSELKDKREQEKQSNSNIKHEVISDKDRDPTAYKKAISNVASFAGAAVSSAVGPTRDLLQKRRENIEKKKEEEKKDKFRQGLQKELNKPLLPAAKSPKGVLSPAISAGARARANKSFRKTETEKRGGTTTEQFCCWREEFIVELGDLRKKSKDKAGEDKIIDVMKGKNKITISPKIQEAHIIERKRDHLTNALFALSFAANAAQSPEALIRSGHIESPSMQLMSRMMAKRRKATVSGLDSARVSHPARNIKKSTVKEGDRLKYLIRNLIAESKSDMKCNKPSRAPKGAKQKYIVKACDGGEDKTLRFGYRGMQDFLQHKDPKRRANFKARHNCADKTNKLTPGWWSCNYSW